MNYSKALIKPGQIKTNFYQPENSKEFLLTLSKLTKSILPLESVIVHKSTMELIANGHYLQLAILEGKEEVEVVLADFPKEHLLHAISTHWVPTKQYSVMFKFIGIFMGYYTKKNGVGAQFREDKKPHALRELVAEILGTNRTYLDWIEAIGNFKPGLLELIDAGEVTLKEAATMVPKTNGKNKNSNSRNTKLSNQSFVPSKNYLTAVNDAGVLTPEEVVTLTENLPQRFAREISNGYIPSELFISKAFAYNGIFQGFSIAYDQFGASVTTSIIYKDALTASLKVA